MSRRTTSTLALVVGAAVVLLLSAPALGVATLVDTPAISMASVQHSPAIAIDPDLPSLAAVAADDGSTAPPYPRTATARSSDWTVAAWSPGGTLLYSGSASAGQPDLAWGNDGGGAQNLYLIELGSTTGGTPTLCSTNAGILFSASPNGGATFPDTPLPIDVGSTTTQLVEPAITVDRSTGRIYVAYTEIKWPSSPCSGPVDSSSILMMYSNDGGTSWSQSRRVSPLATSGSAHFRSPALAALPDGRVVVAFRDDAGPSPQIETETCLAQIPVGGHYCGAASAGAVGPSVVVGDATAPSLVNGLVGPPTPSIATGGGRVTVAWHASSDKGVRAFAAMSTDGGSTFGSALQIDPYGAGNQIAPRLAVTAAGRLDVAYLWDAGNGGVQATVASANPPQPGETTEAWAQPVVVQAIPSSSATPITGQAAPLGRGLGIATTGVPTAASPLAATVVAYTGTQNAGDQDVRVVGLMHGTTTPVIASQTVTASKNVSTNVQVTGTDDDGDPLTWSVGAQPVTPGSTVAISDSARGGFTFKAANVVGSDTFEAVANDGAGHEARTLINVSIVNDPPQILCPRLDARENTPLDVPVAACVSDPNNDPLTVMLSGALGGTVERAGGIWRFIPAVDYSGPASFVLRVDDGDKSAERRVLVAIAKTVGKVTIDVTNAGKQRIIARGMAIRFLGHAVDAQGRTLGITWDFRDGTPTAQGTTVSHRFRKAGTFVVKASASSASVLVKVTVRRRAVEIVGTPRVVDGVMQVRVRTRAAGALSLRVDSRSRTITVPAASKNQTLSIQVTTGPLVRLSLRLKPSKAKASSLEALTVRRLVLVSPRSAG